MVEAANKKTRTPSGRVPATIDEPVPRDVSSLRGRIPQVAPAQAAALRGFFNAPQSWTLRDDGVLQFIPGKPPAPREVFEIDAEGARIGLSLHAARPADGLHWSDYEGRSRVLAWSLAHEPQLMRLSEALGVVLTPLADAAAPADAAGELWLDFIVDDDTDGGGASRMPSLQGALRVPAAWADRLLERADPPYEETPSLGRWRELPVALAVRLRTEPLSPADWAGLRPGDVIVVGRRSRLPPVEAQGSGLAWPLAATADGWQVGGAPRHLSTIPQEIHRMSETPSAADADGTETPSGGDTLARQLPVDLAFEIGRAELRVGELSSLQPGYVFPLPAQLEGANVTIRANGQAVGQGEVVAVGDTLGVRLLWWN